jgi:hypothetical protein
MGVLEQYAALKRMGVENPPLSAADFHLRFRLPFSPVFHSKVKGEKEAARILRLLFPRVRWVYRPEMDKEYGRRITDFIGISVRSGKVRLIGVEVKGSQSDYHSELKNPDKTETFKKYCRKWYIAITDRRILELRSPPDDWGILDLESAKILRKAPALEPVPFDTEILLALLTSHESAGRLHRSLQEVGALQDQLMGILTESEGVE